MVVKKNKDDLMTYLINAVYFFTSIIFNIYLRYFVTQENPIGYEHY